mgnify:CR=1 FL=1
MGSIRYENDKLARKHFDAVQEIVRSNKLSDAIAVLENRSVGILVTTSPEEPMAGVIFEREVGGALFYHWASPPGKPPSDFMTTYPVTLTNETTVVEAMEIMTEKRIRHLPVIDEGKICGLVSIGDVVKRRIMDTEAEAEALKSYIVTG